VSVNIGSVSGKEYFFLEKTSHHLEIASHELVSLPREMPNRRSSAVADVKPTSAKSKVKDLAEFCQLITTEWNNKHDIDSLGRLLPTTVEPSESGPAHTSWSFVYLLLKLIDFPKESCWKIVGRGGRREEGMYINVRSMLYTGNFGERLILG